MSYIGRQLNAPASTVELTAEGAITAGKPCIVEADGDVTQVGQTSISQGVGSAVVFGGSAYASPHSAVFDSSNNKVVFCYSDDSNSGYGTAVVGTVSGTTISFGTPVVFDSNNVGQDTAATFDTSNNKVVIAFRDGGNSNRGTAIVGTVSGTSISFGSKTNFDTDNNQSLGITFDSSSNKVVVCYSDVGNSRYGTAAVGTVSGTSISFGTAVVYESGRAEYNRATFDSTNNKVVIAYEDRDNSQKGKAVVGTVSGTGISFGSITTFEESTIKEYLAITFDSNAGKVFISYQEGDNHRGIVGTVSSTSISFGTAANINDGESMNASCTFDSNANKVVVTFEDKDNSRLGTAAPVTISGTGFSVGTETVFDTDSAGMNSCCFVSSENVVAIQYTGDQFNTAYGRGVIFRNASTPTNLTSENFIGFAENDCTDNGLATIQLGGSVNDKQTSLTAGQTYFVQTDGTIGTTAASPSVTAGTAVSATEILVKG